MTQAPTLYCYNTGWNTIQTKAEFGTILPENSYLLTQKLLSASENLCIAERFLSLQGEDGFKYLHKSQTY